MKKSLLACAAALVGAFVGITALQIARAAGPPAAYMVVEYEVTDRDAFQAYVKAVNALPTSRVFLARHAKATALSGAAPTWVGILRYPSLEEALAFENSPEYQALIATRDKGAKWRAYVVEGLPE